MSPRVGFSALVTWRRCERLFVDVSEKETHLIDQLTERLIETLRDFRCLLGCLFACSLARLLFCDESLWLLDEPYSNLDPQGIAMLDKIIKKHLQSGGACIMTTHGSLRPEGFELQECHMISGRERYAGAAA